MPDKHIIFACAASAAAWGAALISLRGASARTAANLLLGYLLAAAAARDLRDRTIPNVYIVAGAALWAIWLITLAATEGLAAAGRTAAAGAVGGLVSAGGLLLLALAFERITEKPSLGGGDIKLLLVTGLFLGLWRNLVTLALACVLGLLLASTLKRLAPFPEQQREFPFGPAIALATWLALLAG